MTHTYRCEFTRDNRGRAVAALKPDGELLSKLAIWPFTMRIGAAHVRMGGIGGVSTPEKHRHKGYASVVMED